jgi:hypothetical protein
VGPDQLDSRTLLLGLGAVLVLVVILGLRFGHVI